jgi:hypothetical protein
MSPGLRELLMSAEHASTPHHRSYESRSDDATSQLAAKFAVSATIAHPLLVQLFFVKAGLPHLSTPCSSAVAITSITIIVMAGRQVDAQPAGAEPPGADALS